MTRLIFFLIIILIMFSGAVSAKEVAGINMPDTLKIGQSILALNGSGARTKLFIKTYVAGLYLMQKSSDAEKILSADETMAIRLHITSSLITPGKMEEAVREGFQKSVGQNTGSMATQIDKFIAVFRGSIKENDFYEFIYIPNKGVEIYKNGKLFEVIAGLPFKQALFGIWLSDNPVQSRLKEEMLGKI